MKDIIKINSIQLYNLWRIDAIGLAIMALMLLLTYILPYFLAPVVSTAAAFAIYLLAYTPTNRRQSCMIHPAAILLSIINYTIVLIALNVASLWITSFDIWFELAFFSDPFVPILLLAPITALTSFTLLIRGQESSVCTDCRLLNGHYSLRGRWGAILHYEAKVQLKNVSGLFAFIAAGSWIYYFLCYNPVNFTARDSFVFYWLPMLFILFDIIYFGVHYYELYLDLREKNLVVSPQELEEMTTKTWVRYYVICEDSMFLNMHAKDEFDESDSGTVVETPFIVSKEGNGITEGEATSIIKSLTGVHDGKLRFFFGRKSPDNLKHSVVRFFYFLPGELEMYPHLKDVEGTWISSNKFKTIYYNPSLRLAPLLKTDMSRMITIVITSKTFNENGERRTKLKKYHPTFSFEELSHTKLDFQDNAWLRVSCFNSNTSYYKLKRLWSMFTRRNNIPVDE